MGVTHSKAQELLQALTAKAKAAHPDVQSLVFLFDPKSQNKALLSFKQKLKKAPYEAAALTILQREFRLNRPHHSAFLGMAFYKKRYLLGLRERELSVGISTINLAECDTEADIEFAFWHYFSHILDCVALLQNPKYKKSFAKNKKAPLIPKRPALSEARINLKADLFASLVMALNGANDIGSDKIHRRASAALHLHPGHNPAIYPFPLAKDAYEFALQTSMNTSHQSSMLKLCRQLSEEIITAFDKEAIEAWLLFVSKAQLMARMGYAPEEILSAAVNTSDSPAIRGIAGELSETLGHFPLRDFPVDHHYNAYISQAANAKSHENLSNKTFHALVERSLTLKNGDVFVDEAIKQTQDLFYGRGLGWCAHSLIEAARIFDDEKLKEDINGLRCDLVAVFASTNKSFNWENIFEFLQNYLKRTPSMKTQRNEDGSVYINMGLVEKCIEDPKFYKIGETLRHIISLKPDLFQEQLQKPSFAANNGKKQQPSPSAPEARTQEKIQERSQDIQDKLPHKNSSVQEVKEREKADASPPPPPSANPLSDPDFEYEKSPE